MHPQLRSLFRAMFAFMLIWQPMLQIHAQSDSPENLIVATAVDASIIDSLLIDIGDIPTGLTTTPDGRLLIALKYGALKVFDLQSNRIVKDNALNLGGMLCTDSERGLESVTVDPNFASNRYIYVYFTHNGGSGRNDCADSRVVNNRVMRFRLNDDNTTNDGTLIIGNIVSLCGSHNGGDLHFGAEDHKLYVSVGDGGCSIDDWAQTGRSNTNARQMSLLAGKILRLNPDGSIPSDNPFVNSTGAVRCGDSAPRKDSSRVCQEIFATGLRNPFKMAFKAGSNDFYINDVGQDSWEEINASVRGADYGWNLREGSGAGRTDDLTDSIYSYGHQNGLCSITGGVFANWSAPYDEAYFFGDYCGTSVYRLIPNGAGFSRETVIQGYTTYGGVVAMHFDERTKSIFYTLGNGQIRQIRQAGSASATPSPMPTPSPTLKSTNTPTRVPATSQPTSRPTSTVVATSPATATPLATATTRPTSPPASPTAPASGDTPQIRLLAPSPDSPQRYWVGATIYMLAQARDVNDGDISASLTWDFYLRHIPLTHPENEHVHPLGRRFGQLISMTMPAPEDVDAAALSYVEVRLSVSNAQGKTSTLTQPLWPHRVPLTLLTLPAGLQIKINGQPFVGPEIVTAWAGQHLSISVDPIQTAIDPALARTSAFSTLTLTEATTLSTTSISTATVEGPIDPDAAEWLIQQPGLFTGANLRVFMPLVSRDTASLTLIPNAVTGERYRFVGWGNGASMTHTLWVLPFDPYTIVRAEFTLADGTAAPTTTPVVPSPTPRFTATPLPTLPPLTENNVPTTRLTKLARAANVTRWFNNPVSDSDDHYRNYLGASDLDLLRQLKISALRLVVDPALFFNPNKPTSFTGKMHYLDDAVDWLITNKIAVVIELHDKSHMRDWESDSWYVERALSFWQALAQRYASRDPEYLFFEIINEPRFLNDAAGWSAIQTRWVKRMREVAPKHTLIGSANQWSLPSGLTNFAPVPTEANMIYTFHLYEPFEFSHQGAAWMGDRLANMRNLPYPANTPSCMDAANALSSAISRESARRYCQSGWGADMLEARIRAMADWGRQHQLPVWMGEFGVYCNYADADSRARWLNDARTLAEKYGIGWAIWGYDDCFGLDRKWRDGRLVVDETAKAALGP